MTNQIFWMTWISNKPPHHLSKLVIMLFAKDRHRAKIRQQKKPQKKWILSVLTLFHWKPFRFLCWERVETCIHSLSIIFFLKDCQVLVTVIYYYWKKLSCKNVACDFVNDDIFLKCIFPIFTSETTVGVAYCSPICPCYFSSIVRWFYAERLLKTEEWLFLVCTNWVTKEWDLLCNCFYLL